MKRLLSVFLIISISALSCGSEKYKVLYVVDGDTISVEYMNKPERVRLIGIDTPESRINDKVIIDSKRQNKGINQIVALGRMAKAFVKSILTKGDYVTLEFDVQYRD